MNEELPLLPYAGTSGWSGTETSKQRAITADKNGTTRSRQRKAMFLLAEAGEAGLTWKELGDLTGWHHGTVSGLLSVLNRENYIVRLKATRNKCAIYVHPNFISSREISQRKTKTCKHCGGEL